MGKGRRLRAPHPRYGVRHLGAASCSELEASRTPKEELRDDGGVNGNLQGERTFKPL